ncbi:diacylglycerol/lipid kinase family protein [Haploplasma axanthum]|uniref:diacylglycerol kinase (ATP) n=1 Tax=Haploplasma axanthum TaxID=29552 RepID=A0A449BFK1_HAPAX|nr:diacylglycerol kinase family protein [Haploplasma axanthum]VEU81195.1 Diacylglycerol kinase [Haploplasma axanthum]
MDIILYNPLSRNGKNIKLVNKLKKKLNKKGRIVDTINLLEITDIELFVTTNQNIDRFIIIGGDGTLNRLVNGIRGIDIKPGIFLYKAGTGNDFIRSLPGRKKGLIDVKDYLKKLPKVSFNNREMLFLNGVGLGLDGLVCHKVNNSKYKKNKFNYFRHALEAFREFVPRVSKVFIDGLEIQVDKTWFVSVMNSKYFGGGMKIAPKASRLNDTLEVVIIKKVPKFILLTIFPTIYLGWHTKLKKYVNIYKGKEVKVVFDQGVIMQIDGDDFTDIKEITAIK